jgi:hypothetical protein
MVLRRKSLETGSCQPLGDGLTVKTERARNLGDDGMVQCRAASVCANNSHLLLAVSRSCELLKVGADVSVCRMLDSNHPHALLRSRSA